MRIIQLAGYWIRVPLRRSVHHAKARYTYSENLVVCCRLANGVEGWGEGVPRALVTGEKLEAVWQEFIGASWSDLLREDVRSWEEAISLCDRLRIPATCYDPRQAFGNSLRCALELSILDAFGRLFSQPVSSVTATFAPASAIYDPQDSVRFSATIAGKDAWTQLLIACWVRWYGFAQCKLKVGLPGSQDLKQVQRIRRLLGPEIDLRLDANGAWSPEEFIRLAASLEPYRISCIEQPVPDHQLSVLAAVRQQIKIPIMLDESVCSLADARRAVDLKVCDLINIRLSKCGGFLPSLRIAAWARSVGLGYQLGCHPGETGILSAAGRHFATSVGGLRYLEGSYDRLLFRRLITKEDLTLGKRGWAPALRGPGLGVTVNRRVLAACSKRQWTVQLA